MVYPCKENLCLNPDYSTTRRLIREKPLDLRVLEENRSRQGEGGLRVEGYYKQSGLRSPLITVLTPIYNAAACIERSIKSVLEQPYDNVEYILIDGGSTDGTLDIIRKYEDYIDYWVSEDDKGIYDAMNKGTSVSAGDWIYFLGSDDILVNNLHKVAPFLRKKNRIYYGNVYWPRQNRVYDGEFKWHKLVNKNICQQAIFYPKRVFDIYKYDRKYRTCADYALNIKCWGHRQFRFKYIPILVCIFNDSGACFQCKDMEFEKDKPGLIRQNFSRQILLRKLYGNVRTTAMGLLSLFGLKEPLRQLLGFSRRLIGRM